ncbi:MAG: hypothetical protein HC896_12695 [Bacteroidales bacterium]|nr:hypothetical protein [Bacteroidales bacterium]
MNRFFLGLIILGIGYSLQAQNINNYVEKHFTASADSVALDSLSIVPGSEIVMVDGVITNAYIIDYKNAKITMDSTLSGKTIYIAYRAYTIDIQKAYYHGGRARKGIFNRA